VVVNLRNVFDPEGLNWWTIVSGIGMNFALMAFLFLGMTGLSTAGMMSGVLYPLAICGGAFLIPLGTAYVCGRMADERYLTYGLYSLVGFLVLAVPGVVVGGTIGLLILGFGVLGAFNGATLAARRAARRRREIYGDEYPGSREGKR
jgi:hypothetical protein